MVLLIKSFRLICSDYILIQCCTPHINKREKNDKCFYCYVFLGDKQDVALILLLEVK